MKLTFSLLDWQASAPGLGEADEWLRWAGLPAFIDPKRPLAKCNELPMMTARRLNSGSRAAVDCGLALLRRQKVDAIVFTSRHGELERNLRILRALAQEEETSPTDFAMSVHNAAAGSLTIAAAMPLVTTSLAAGMDTFQQGLVEAAALQSAGYERILLVDFDGVIPEFYQDAIPVQMPRYPYAVALLLTKGKTMSCESDMASAGEEPSMAQSLQFLHAALAEQPRFVIYGERLAWRWTRYGG
ncbi:beta-ketoacyl synthase chain length factor [Sodalis ligni]|uniref:Beta-ketoacyl synthase-like protein n=1 Tax=Sodalis ligni TaxID=2697027 RepID=A0A4R1NBB9_9GAMM|nr:beta-ketoacyl synthase chain length factor [Sodalis ligni]TCL04067.1 beta-ketoacyl synthase-like protein [Sodalis ligni]